MKSLMHSETSTATRAESTYKSGKVVHTNGATSSMRNTPRRSLGFTLIEIAVVLFIGALILGAVITMLDALMINSRSSATHKKENAIKVVLSNFLMRNIRLPCPAIATLADGAANEGVETDHKNVCSGTTVSGAGINQVAVGVVPWQSLGISAEAALDAYANRFTYLVAVSATALTPATVTGMTGNMTTHSAGLGELKATPTGNQLNDCSNGATTNPCALVVAVISHGRDGSGAYTRFGKLVPFPASVTGNDELDNANADSKLVIKDYSNVDSNPFDDIVLGMTAGDLLTPLVLVGTFKDYRATLKSTLDVIQASVIADTADDRSGLEGDRKYKLPDNIDDLSLSQKSDPWGTQISYTKNKNDIMNSTNPSETAFTLKSNGPDKSTGGVDSVDDISLVVTVGEMQNILQYSGW